MRKKIYCLSLFFVLGLVACQSVTPGVSSSFKPDCKDPSCDMDSLITTHFQCGDKGTVFASFMHDKLHLRIAGDEYVLVETPSASGARYETSKGVSPHVIFWNKGREAMLTYNGKNWPTCVEEDK